MRNHIISFIIIFKQNVSNLLLLKAQKGEENRLNHLAGKMRDLPVELGVTISQKQKKVPTSNSETAAGEEWLSCFDMLRNGMENGKENISFLRGQKRQISVIDPEKSVLFLSYNVSLNCGTHFHQTVWRLNELRGYRKDQESPCCTNLLLPRFITPRQLSFRQALEHT